MRECGVALSSEAVCAQSPCRFNWQKRATGPPQLNRMYRSHTNYIQLSIYMECAGLSSLADWKHKLGVLCCCVFTIHNSLKCGVNFRTFSRFIGSSIIEAGSWESGEEEKHDRVSQQTRILLNARNLACSRECETLSMCNEREEAYKKKEEKQKQQWRTDDDECEQSWNGKFSIRPRRHRSIAQHAFVSSTADIVLSCAAQNSSPSPLVGRIIHKNRP